MPDAVDERLQQVDQAFDIACGLALMERTQGLLAAQGQPVPRELAQALAANGSLLQALRPILEGFVREIEPGAEAVDRQFGPHLWFDQLVAPGQSLLRPGRRQRALAIYRDKLIPRFQREREFADRLARVREEYAVVLNAEGDVAASYRRAGALQWYDDNLPAGGDDSRRLLKLLTSVATDLVLTPQRAGRRSWICWPSATSIAAA